VESECVGVWANRERGTGHSMQALGRFPGVWVRGAMGPPGEGGHREKGAPEKGAPGEGGHREKGGTGRRGAPGEGGHREKGHREKGHREKGAPGPSTQLPRVLASPLSSDSHKELVTVTLRVCVLLRRSKGLCWMLKGYDGVGLRRF